MSTRLLPSQHSAGIATACAAAYFVVLAFAAFICASSFGTYHDRILYEDASDASNVAFLLPRALSIGLGTSLTICAIAGFVFVYMAMVANATNARLLRAYAIVLGIAFVAQVTAHGLCWCIAFLGQNMRGLTTACGVLPDEGVKQCDAALKSARLWSALAIIPAIGLFVWSSMTYRKLYKDLRVDSTDAEKGGQASLPLVEHSVRKHGQHHGHKRSKQGHDRHEGRSKRERGHPKRETEKRGRHHDRKGKHGHKEKHHEREAGRRHHRKEESRRKARTDSSSSNSASSSET